MLLVQSITNKIILYCFIFTKGCFETTFLGMASKLKFMLPYFSFIAKYFNRGNSGLMPDHFYHDINKIEVTLMSFQVFFKELCGISFKRKNLHPKSTADSDYLKYELLTACHQI